MLKLSCKLMMAGTSKDRALIDIGQTVKNHSSICDFVLAVHALSRCDTPARMNGIGKGKVLRALLKRVKLTGMADPNAVWGTYNMKLPILNLCVMGVFFFSHFKYFLC